MNPTPFLVIHCNRKVQKYFPFFITTQIVLELIRSSSE